MKITLLLVLAVQFAAAQNWPLHHLNKPPERVYTIPDSGRITLMTVESFIALWDEYLVWCADTVQKRGWDWLVMIEDSSSQKDSAFWFNGERLRLSYYARSEPTYYPGVREVPSFFGYVEWLRQNTLAGRRMK